MECPKRCSGRNSNRQHEITQAMLEEVDESERERVQGAMRCSYCGCVYDRMSGQALGWYNAAMMEQGWHLR